MKDFQLSDIEKHLLTEIARDKDELRKKFNETRRKFDNTFSVGLIGLGEIGKVAYGNFLGNNAIDKIYFSTGTKKTLDWACDEALTRGLDRIVAVEYDEMHQMRDADLIFITIDANQKKDVPRRQYLEKNLKPIRRIANLLQGYDGHVVMVTNPIEEMSYAFSSVSGITPGNVIGLMGVDTERVKTQLIKKLARYRKKEVKQGEFEIYTIGTHSPNFTVIYHNFAGYDIDMLPLHDISLQVIEEEAKQLGQKQILREGTTRISTAYEISKVVDAFLYSYIDPSVLCVSTWLKHNDRIGLYFGYPCKFEDGSIIPQPQLVELDDHSRQRILDDWNSLEASVQSLIRKEKCNLINHDAPLIQEYEDEIKTVPMHVQKFPPDTRIVAATSNQLLNWDANKNPFKPEVLFEYDDIETALIREIGEDYLCFFGDVGKIKAYNIDTGKITTFQSPGKRTIIDSELFNINDVQYLVGVSRDNGVFVWDYATKKLLSKTLDGMGNGAYSIAKGYYGRREIAFVSGLDTYMFDPSIPGQISNVFTNEEYTQRRHYNQGSLNFANNTLYAGLGIMTCLWDIRGSDVKAINHGIGEIGEIVGNDDIVLVSSFDNSQVLDISGDIQTYRKDANHNGTSTLCLGKGVLSDFVLAGDKYYPGSVTVPQITAWHQGRPDSPWTVLGGAEKSIKALEFILK